MRQSGLPNLYQKVYCITFLIVPYLSLDPHNFVNLFCMSSEVSYSNGVMNVKKGAQARKPEVIGNWLNKQQVRYSSTSISRENDRLNTRVISGFVDGEGCFSLIIYKDNLFKIGWRVKLIFKIALHLRDKELLELIKNYYKVGNITNHGRQSVVYRVSSIKDLGIIINLLDQCPLITQKYADYLLFKQAYFIIKNKEHLSEQGVRKFVSIKASENMGLSPELKSAFPDIIPAIRPALVNQKIYKDWVRGFASAEGCFSVNFSKSTSSKSVKVHLVFQLTQHSRDEKLMWSFIDYFDCGSVYKDANNFVFRVSNVADIDNKIIPFFQEYPILGNKKEDFQDFCHITAMVKNKKHLTVEGLEEIRLIKAGMNRGRS